MSHSGSTVFDKTIQTTDIWLNDMMEISGWRERHDAYHALRAVLHALRDRLDVDDVAALGAQLPMLVRGFYYEGWHPAGKPLKERKKKEFLAHVSEAFRDRTDIDAEKLVRAAFQVLKKHITPGEIERVVSVLPAELRSLWPRHGSVAGK